MPNLFLPTHLEKNVEETVIQHFGKDLTVRYYDSSIRCVTDMAVEADTVLLLQSSLTTVSGSLLKTSPSLLVLVFTNGKYEIHGVSTYPRFSF